MRAPLPSNTQGPASFLGVIGPSCTLDGPALLGLGVLRPLIDNGSEVACEPSLFGLEDPIVDGVLSPPPLGACSDIGLLSTEFDMVTSGASSRTGVETEAAGKLVRDRDRSSEVLALSAALALARSSDVLILSTEVLPTSTGAGGSRRGSFDRLSSGFPAFSGSSSNCSQSSGSSTSASKSAAARQLGQMKIG